MKPEHAREPAEEVRPDSEGLFDQQLSLPLPSVPQPPIFRSVVKRDGSEEHFDRAKIAEAILKAAESVGGHDRDVAQSLAAAVEIYLGKRFTGKTPTVDHVHDAVERVLIQMSHAQTALAYARYRDRRARIRRLREGDMRVLLSELEEARFAREAAHARRETPLFVRTSSDTMSEWDQRKIADALVREAGLDATTAQVIAHEVEEQIERAGIVELTTSLVRELAGAKLIEHGLDEFRERHRRLGVPLYDTENILRGRTPETVCQHPGATDEVLARAVKKEYALAQVYSSGVAEAHLRGDIHLRALDKVDRLYRADHALAFVALHGVRVPGGFRAAEPAGHGDTLLAHMVKHDELMRHFFAGPTRWTAVNFFFAPFLYGLEQAELNQFAQMLLYEYAYRALAAGQEVPATELEIQWTVPGALKYENAIGPGGEVLQNTYKEFEHTAQQFAWALIEQFKIAADGGVALPSPRLSIVLDDAFFGAHGHEGFLLHAAAAAEIPHPLTFRLRRGSHAAQPNGWRASHVLLPPVVLNLPRAAFRACKEAALGLELERQLEFSLRAHRERRDFLEALGAAQGSPLGMIAWNEDAEPYADLAEAIAPVAIEGLYECVRYLRNQGLETDADARACGEAILTRLRDRCETLGAREGIRLRLDANEDVRAGRRLAAIDSAEYPKSVASVLQLTDDTDALRYATGVSLPHQAALRPWDRAYLDGTWTPYLGDAAPTRIPLPEGGMTAGSIADFLRKLYRESRCNGVIFG
ncbi:MAG: hypothetical protein GC168_19290 [Candidatus Hydrogenedens sp.]|nr:hypothetical protein [Candidatus Hydrogenedens sp.]